MSNSGLPAQDSSTTGIRLNLAVRRAFCALLIAIAFVGVVNSLFRFWDLESTFGGVLLWTYVVANLVMYALLAISIALSIIAIIHHFVTKRHSLVFPLLLFTVAIAVLTFIAVQVALSFRYRAAMEADLERAAQEETIR